MNVEQVPPHQTAVTDICLPNVTDRHHIPLYPNPKGSKTLTIIGVRRADVWGQVSRVQRGDKCPDTGADYLDALTTASRTRLCHHQ